MRTFARCCIGRHTRRGPRKRAAISPEKLDRYLTDRLHEVPGFEAVDISAGYRLRVPDDEGCNWSGKVVALHGLRAPLADDIAVALRPIVRAARARFNLSE
ncbi:MAG TPA: hypothetical protein VFS52_21440 [Steroidobacteraceae bacterium]|nr:hypothetical protein [Steroidobacteraceae bacterium]